MNFNWNFLTYAPTPNAKFSDRDTQVKIGFRKGLAHVYAQTVSFLWLQAVDSSNWEGISYIANYDCFLCSMHAHICKSHISHRERADWIARLVVSAADQELHGRIERWLIGSPSKRAWKKNKPNMFFHFLERQYFPASICCIHREYLFKWCRK